MPRPELSLGWCEPTPETLTRYQYGIEHGLVPAGASVLSQPAEAVTAGKFDEAAAIAEQLRKVAKAIRKAGRPMLGIAGPQIGESAQVMLVPGRRIPTRLVAVINGEFVPDEGAEMAAVNHGCLSTDQAVSRLLTPRSGTLYGFDEHGEPLQPLKRNVRVMAAADQHELWHMQGIRPPDIAIEQGRQIDCVPPEVLPEYKPYVRGWERDPNGTPEWMMIYPPEQWLAVKAGQLTMGQFIE